MSRVYINHKKKKIVILSYAGATKYFRHLSETKLKSYNPCNANHLTFEHRSYEIIQVVREPVSRYMSWFDKQYIKPKYRSKVPFDEWVNNLLTIEWIDNFFEEAQYSLHYDGHTCYQSIWPKIHIKIIYDDSWKFLKMEDINPYFLKEEKFEVFRDPEEYIGVWEVLNKKSKDHLLAKIVKVYTPDIYWYNNLEFISPK